MGGKNYYYNDYCYYHYYYYYYHYHYHYYYDYYYYYCCDYYHHHHHYGYECGFDFIRLASRQIPNPAFLVCPYRGKACSECVVFETLVLPELEFSNMRAECFHRVKATVELEFEAMYN